MALPLSGKDREYNNFTDNGDGTTSRFVKLIDAVLGSFRPSGLNVGGRHLEITINDSSWTALPLSPLADRNQINIQNFSGFEIKVNLDSGAVGYSGMRIPSGTERFYQITENIIIYAKSESGSGSVVIDVEELA